MNPTAAAVAALLDAHSDDEADTLVGAMSRFKDELGLALLIAADADEGHRLDALVVVARRLAAEPDSPTVPAWEAWLRAVAGLRAGGLAEASPLADEAARWLADQG